MESISEAVRAINDYTNFAKTHMSKCADKSCLICRESARLCLRAEEALQYILDRETPLDWVASKERFQRGGPEYDDALPNSWWNPEGI